MVVTRSQCDAAELEEQRRVEERGLEEERIDAERRRRLSRDPPASPSMQGLNAGMSTFNVGVGTPIDASNTGTSNAVPRPTSPSPSQRSRRTTTPTRQRTEIESARRLYEIECRLAEIEQEKLLREAAFIRKGLASANGSDSGPLRERADAPNNVDEWLRNTPILRGEGGAAPHRVDPRKSEEQRARTPERPRNDVEDLTRALTLKAMQEVAQSRPPLPVFSGEPLDWLTFKKSMINSTIKYNISPEENLQRLHNCLKGDARQAVGSLLCSATDPNRIMKTLEQRFGMPDIIADQVVRDLRRLPKTGTGPSELNRFATTVENLVISLQNLGQNDYLNNRRLVEEIIEKVPELKLQWRYYVAKRAGTSTEPRLIWLSRFLMEEGQIATSFSVDMNVATRSTPATSSANAVGGARKKAAVYATTDDGAEEINRCPSCGDAHALHRCATYRALRVEQRWDLVREKGLCFRCVEKTHRRYQCKTKPCGVNQCRRPHHSSLHEDAAKPAPTPGVQPRAEKKESDAMVLSVVSNGATDTSTVLLKVCPVIVSGPRGEVETYALLDDGAAVTLIDHELAMSIGADGPTRPLNMSGASDGWARLEEDSKRVAVHVRGKNENAMFKIAARTVRSLNLRRQTVPRSLLRQSNLRHLHEEEVCYEQARPLLLVGSDHLAVLMTHDVRVGGPDRPAAVKTALGWVVQGSAPRSLIYGDSESVLHVYAPDPRVHKNEAHDQRLHELVEHHFRIDALGVALKPRVSDADERAVNIFNETVKKIDGGYEVGLPWRHDHVALPPSYAAAANRLRGIEKKMDADPAFAKEYSDQMSNLLAKGYAVPCDGTESQSAICWYLPHFAVENPNKPGKRRLVFDAAHRNRGVCLNDLLLEGPDLLLSLPGIIFRFRERSVAVIADIQEMFLRVKIRPSDQPAQQFLWRGEDRTNPPRLYKMTSMIFGAASSPFMAHSVRNYNAYAHAESHPRALVAITRSHYMDDFVDSYSDENEARRTIEELRAVHAVAGFTLRGWSSNKPEVLSDVPAELRATELTPLGGASAESKILGLCWNAKEDELGFNTTMPRVPADVRTLRRAPTKREALSVVMSIYDPLGLLSQYTIRAKIVLQSLWRLQMPWDEPIPEEEAEQFAAWLQQLDEITQLRLPRSYALEGHRNVELHVMCDASEQAYATVAYWRSTHRDGSVSVALVAAKAKVAPRRTQSIPRLELQAAVIGARIADAIKKEHRIEIARTIYWTDSATVVHWIRNDARRYTPFVAHRLGEIAELTHRDEWRWLPTNQNVADDATRLNCTPITADDRWFQGPCFLLTTEAEWPVQRSRSSDEEEVLHTTERDEQRPLDGWLPDPTRFSTYEKLVRAAARVLAFVDMCRRRAARLEMDHIERAERAVLRRAQEDSFGAELRKIEADRPIPRTSRLYKLDPVLENGLLRVRGRIAAATAPTEMKRPVILDGRHHITRLLVLKEHCAASHANRERVTNDLRQRYWVIHLRPTVRAVEHGCALCRVRKATPRAPTTGDLPRARLDPFHRPFTNCGLDYFGPMMVKIGRRREKRWGALFTCLTTRAVHLELVESLSTDSAIMALRRMAARRGWPLRMYSDNATNFRGADQELKRAYAEWGPALRDEGLRHRMKWHYIPPGAPNQGGAWERLVRSVKTALAATLREKAPPSEVLQTVLAEAEHSINARPLTHVSVSPRDPEALTPNHFLLGSSMGLPTTGPCNEADRRVWRTSQALADAFWRRWVREYLPTLVPRGEPTDLEKGLRVGDIVVVVDQALPRNVWPIGIVERLYPGPDGGVRVVDVRTRTGVFKRPSRKLAVLVKEEATQAAPGGELLRTA